MKIDESKSSATRPTCEEKRQNRREFFNGLGKWSMIVVAAVSLLREEATDSEASHQPEPRPESQRPTWTRPDDLEKPLLASKKKPHGDHSKYYKGYNRFGPGGPDHSDLPKIQ